MTARRRPLVIVAALTLLGLAGLAAWRLLAPPELPRSLIAVSGRIEGDDAAIAAKTAGRIREVTVREGDRVEPGHRSHVPRGGQRQLWIEERDPRDANLVTLIAFSGDLDRIWPTTILATTAGAGGMDVAVFFTFWGLFPLVRNDRGITGKNWMQRMLAAMNRGGTANLKLSKMNFFGMGPAMMRTLAKRHNVASPQELLETARDMGVKLIPCQMTMDLMGLTSADLIDGLEDPAGAATALAVAEGATTLFI